MSDRDLIELARAAGLAVEWSDAAGKPQTVAPSALRAILDAMGLPSATAGDLRESHERLRVGDEPDFITADAGVAIRIGTGRARLRSESGQVEDVDAAAIRVDVPGYHRLELDDREITLAVAPQRCFGIGDAAGGRRIWGTAVQLYALNERAGSSHGDFGALASFARAAGRGGADAIAISPVHALFPADAGRFGPYAPSTRLFLNPLFADPALVGDTAADDAPAGDLIGWDKAIPARFARLRQLFDTKGAGSEIASAIDAFAREQGEDLRLHAVFDALHGHFFARGLTGGWQGWPEEYRDPHGTAVAAFAREHEREVRFHLFLQWLTDRSLAEAQGAARDAGMAIGLVADLAVGMDAGGSHAWSRRADLLDGLSVGAPPDIFQPAGQNWGIAAFSPQALRASGYAAFLATLRSAMRHAGGVRIDHAMGLRRLWLVPHGAEATEGAYLTYPMEDLLRLVTLESARSRAVVIAEDLGTVPEGFREALDARGILGMRVLWFERADDGGFIAPGEWSRSAAAMTTTHDLPTVAGWWRGRDIDWTFDLGRKSNFDTAEEARADRARDRERLWSAVRYSGAASGDPPPADRPQDAVDPVLRFVARTACELAILPVEDLLGLEEQPNLPGTIDEHPNWRRRLSAPAEALFAEPAVAARIDHLNQERPK